jgi:mRNA interferase MazF
VTRGEIYFVNLNPVVGREQFGTRPVLVVSSAAVNALPLVVTVIPGTKAARGRPPLPSNVLVTAAESGLPMDTIFLGFQVRALDWSRFPAQPAGHIPPARMADVSTALRFVLGL